MRSSSYLFQSLIFGQEFRFGCAACAGDPKAIMGDKHHGEKDSLFKFSTDEYKVLFGDAKPCGWEFSFGAGPGRKEMLIARKEMVEEVFKKLSDVDEKVDVKLTKKMV